jgi:hypothetical protein
VIGVTPIVTVRATDRDQGRNGRITYQVRRQFKQRKICQKSSQIHLVKIELFPWKKYPKNLGYFGNYKTTLLRQQTPNRRKLIKSGHLERFKIYLCRYLHT